MRKKNVFLTEFNGDGLDSIPVCDYSPKQLVGYLLKYYSANPMVALNDMRYNIEVGELLYTQAKIILEGAGYAET